MTESADCVTPSVVHLALDDGALVARVDPRPPVDGARFAFYLQRDGKRVETRWYSDEPSARFASPADASRYRVVGFVRRPGEAQAEMVVSASLHRAVPRGRGVRLDGLKVHEVEIGSLGDILHISGRLRLDVQVPGLPFTYQCLLLRKPGDRLFVVLGGAVPDRAEVELPRFNRFSWAPDFPGSVLCIADPTLRLDDHIRLGWYFGRADADATTGLCDVTAAIASAIGLRREQIVSYGSSGGGFAAMQLAARLGDGATAIAINPQTDVLRYAQKGSVREFLTVCTGGMRESIARERLGHRLRLAKAWRAPESARSRCLLVQNLRDRHHYNEHFLAFAAAFDVPVPGISADGRIGTMTYDHPNGHGAEPRSMVPAILERAFALRVPTQDCDIR